MFKVVAASFFSAVVGGVTVCTLLDAPPPPASDPVAADLSPRVTAQLNALSARLDEVERQLALHVFAPPARTEVVTPPAEVDTLVARVDKLSDEVARLQKTTASPTTVAEQLSMLTRMKSMQPADQMLGLLANSLQGVENSPLRVELEQRRKALGMNDAPGLVQLAEWAEGQGLKTESKRLLRQAIKVDPDTREARERLGYKRFENRWRTEADIKRLLQPVESEGS